MPTHSLCTTSLGLSFPICKIGEGDEKWRKGLSFFQSLFPPSLQKSSAPGSWLSFYDVDVGLKKKKKK